MKDETAEKVQITAQKMKFSIKDFFIFLCTGLRIRTYSYLVNDRSEDKKAKNTKMCVVQKA